MKTFDLEKLQSLTLSGEKITKEIFEALFVHQTPYYFANQPSSVCAYNYTTPTPYEEPGLPPYQQRIEESFSTKNYEIFRGAFETAASCSKSVLATETVSDYQYCDNRFYQGQNYFQGF